MVQHERVCRQASCRHGHLVWATDGGAGWGGLGSEGRARPDVSDWSRVGGRKRCTRPARAAPAAATDLVIWRQAGRDDTRRLRRMMCSRPRPVQKCRLAASRTLGAKEVGAIPGLLCPADLQLLPFLLKPSVRGGSAEATSVSCRIVSRACAAASAAAEPGFAARRNIAPAAARAASTSPPSRPPPSPPPSPPGNGTPSRSAAACSGSVRDSSAGSSASRAAPATPSGATAMSPAARASSDDGNAVDGLTSTSRCTVCVRSATPSASTPPRPSPRM
eukprot:359153-Chlamydomonas_euryale.AAC.1